MEYLYNPVASTIGDAAGMNVADTTLTLSSATLFPSVCNYRVIVDAEIMLVTGIAGAVLTVTRAQEGTVASVHSVGALVTLVATAQALENVFSAGSAAWIGAHGAKITASAAQSIANNTGTLLSLGTVVHDTDSYASNPGGAGRLTVPAGQAGVYMVGAGVAFAPNAAGERFMVVYYNGGAGPVFVRGNANATASADTALNGSSLVVLAVGDYVTLGVYQGSGGALNSEYNSPSTPVLWMWRVA